jgi:hypothetical protein
MALETVLLPVAAGYIPMGSMEKIREQQYQAVVRDL